MSCLICVGIAARIRCRGPLEDRDCPEGERYRMADELVWP